MTADRFIRIALTALMKNPGLLDCTPESVINCCLQLSSLGLEPDGRRAHLIPYKDRKNNTVICTLIVDYKGTAELCFNSGLVSNIHADVVCENDVFEYDRGEVKAHKIDFRRDRGEPYAAYCIIRFKDGTEKADAMTKAEIYLVRDKSSGWLAYKAGYAKQNPWADRQSEPEMWKKTIFKRVSKWVKLSPEVVEALEKEDQVFSSASLVTDLQPTAPAIVHHEPEALPEPQPDPADDVPMDTPAPVPPAPPVANPLQEQLAKVCKDAGFDYDDFGKWAIESGNVPDADTKGGFDEIHEAICKRLLRSQVGMLKGIATTKGMTP